MYLFIYNICTHCMPVCIYIYMCVCVCVCVCVYIYILVSKYIYIYIYNCWNIYVYVSACILSSCVDSTYFTDSLSLHLFLLSIAPGRSSNPHPVSSQTRHKLVLAGQPTLAHLSIEKCHL